MNPNGDKKEADPWGVGRRITWERALDRTKQLATGLAMHHELDVGVLKARALHLSQGFVDGIFLVDRVD